MVVRIQFMPSGRHVDVAVGTTILEAARSAGLPVASSCGAHGLCARCGVEILRGGEAVAPELPQETDAKTRNRIPSSLRLSCLVAPETDLVVTAPYW